MAHRVKEIRSCIKDVFESAYNKVTKSCFLGQTDFHIISRIHFERSVQMTRHKFLNVESNFAS